MHIALPLLIGLAFVTPVHASLLGFLTSKARAWEVVESIGGIVLHTPEIRDGNLVLSVDYSPKGHAGLVVRTIELKHKGSVVTLCWPS